MAGAGAAIGAIVAGAAGPSQAVLLAVVATGLVTAGGNAMNDVTDRHVDAQAHPTRPLPSGRVTPTRAASLAAGAFTLAMVAAWLVSWALLGLVLLATAALLAYEAWLKASGLAGNLLVAGLVALTFVAGAIAHGSTPWPVGFLAGASFFANVGREAWKDTEDAPHDVGRRTVAQRWGDPAAVRFGQAATLVAIVLSPLPLLVGFGGWPFLGLVAAADLVFLAAVIAPTPGQAQTRSKLGMLVALVAFTVGAIA